MLLRSVVEDDLGAYVAMRCDPRMMKDLGGPRAPEDMPEKVARDVAEANADRQWILMICPDDDPRNVAGTVTLWAHDGDGTRRTEIGWMVLPEFQGQGLARAAVEEVLHRAALDGRWGPVHAFAGVTNEASNRLCRAVGFQLLGQESRPFAGRTFDSLHWVIEPSTERG